MSGPVRAATRDDLPALRAIQLATLAQPWPELLTVGVDGPPLLLVYDDAGPSGYALALTEPGDWGADDRPGGTGTRVATETGEGTIAADPDGVPTRDGDGAAAYLVELAVARPRQGEGRGSALLSALAGRLRARGYGRLSVTVRAADERALSFYRERGFATVRRLSGHYETGDGHLLVRRL